MITGQHRYNKRFQAALCAMAGKTSGTLGGDTSHKTVMYWIAGIGESYKAPTERSTQAARRRVMATIKPIWQIRILQKVRRIRTWIKWRLMTPLEI